MPKTIVFTIAVALAANAQKIETEKSDRHKVIRLETAPNHLSIIELADPVTDVAAGSSSFKIEWRGNKGFVQPLDPEALYLSGAAFTASTPRTSWRKAVKAWAPTREPRSSAAAGRPLALSIIGAIAGGGKGAGIGAGAGAGAGVLTQMLTKGRSIRVPAESVLTFRLDRPFRVTAVR